MNSAALRARLLEEFSARDLDRMEEIFARHQGQPGSLIPVLEEVQGITGYLPDVLQEWIALGLGLPRARVFGVVTFYSFFSRVPKGKHQIKVCLGTACYVRGSNKIVERLEGELGIKAGGVTGDRKFSLETLRCVGACGLAPVMIVGEDTYGQLAPDGVKEILASY
jgi:NADH-quinone oxidoreductase subunit E/NADP-reducing hydrogenase subunit HndA